MRLFDLLIVAVLCLMVPLMGVNNIKTNPYLPTGFTKGRPVRSIALTKVLKITDGSGDFFFKHPRRIKIAADNSVFIQDHEKLYQFDSSGKFIRNYFVKGEGPGELRGLSNYFFLKDEIVMGGFMPFTILKKNLKDGSVVDEYRDPKAKPFTTMIYGNDEGYFVSVDDVQFSKLKTGINERINKILYYDSENKRSDPGLSFKTLDAMIKKTGKEGVMVAMDEVTHLLNAFGQNRYGYLAHTKRYLIKQIDLKSKKIIREFKRQYQPVTYIQQEYDEDLKQELHSQYKQDYFNDIYALRIYKDKLLVFTSTLDREKGILVDVFNNKGIYIDCVYIKLPGVERPDDLRRKPICFGDDCLWTAYADEDENPLVVKYKFKL